MTAIVGEIRDTATVDVLSFPRQRDDYVNNSDPNDRRKYARTKLRVPVEIETDAGGSPIRGATADLSLSGCYIETIFPFPIGTNLHLQLSIETTILIVATVVTCDPQVGNGIRFIRMLPEDREALKAFVETAQQAQKSGSRGAGAS